MRAHGNQKQQAAWRRGGGVRGAGAARSRKFVQAYFDDVLRCPLHFLQPLQNHLLVGRYVEFLSFQSFNFLLYSVKKRQELCQ